MTMTRKEKNEYIRQFDTKSFRDEIAHYMGIEDREYNYDEVCALLDMEDHEATTNTDKWLARQCLIDIGFYRPMTDDEVDNTVTSSGRKPWQFKMNSIPYTSDFNKEEWFDEIDEMDT